ncbi:L-glutamate gamma-semialdehyde dehydrogenase [Marivirga arenosa]|uniref:L-glutamate gamma-semialdehyde dehydrogenase n=1 Tax=Marivirga arenosa TaxID=3059076 RepID=A0AA51R5Y1_9BACT|nr:MULTISPECIES: L-glutamate gamma-semialdehyde dehydrogenase [unclassified Marivirga]WMN06127.1 L-glutamate gamma-semialdehyde dehydrogenase [Marivirga sp. ABR2-2]WNB17541.1 L-glutamate gamma-semialdehyde dehydrogenase [Marivirga sp. BKB1-2]
MSTAIYKVPVPKNEPVNSYAPGTPERASLQAKLKELRSQEVDVPMYIGAEEVRTGKTHPLNPPHDHQHKLGQFHEGDASHVDQAIKAALAAKQEWADLHWQQRAAVFLKAADLIAGPYRDKINAATMLGQSKNAYQAEIDSACELADFLRFNVKYMTEIYEEQPYSPDGIWNRMEYRPLEGFVFALTPFNFTAIAGNLPSSAALMGNTVVWKPAYSQIYSANVVMEIFREAGVPDGVINLIYVDGPTVGKKVFTHPDFAGIHFTGSTAVFQTIWKTIGENIETYKSYPRIVGETGGKDFILAHKTADAKQVATAITRGAFEYQGQKCSAASRVYVANNIWDDVKKNLLADIKDIKMGGPEDFDNFFNAVIDRKAFDKIKGYIDHAKESNVAEVIAGGECDDSKGYFIQPTVIVTKDPQYVTMQEEIFGPVVTIYVYEAENFDETLTLVDETSPYALTGAIFSNDRYIIEKATKRLSQAAGNFYVNDKPTGAVVNQNPFGGARKSGTNDKAGSKLNLLRWCSARMVKETFVTPSDYKYPFMGE